LKLLIKHCNARQEGITPGGFEHYVRRRIIYTWYKFDTDGDNEISLEDVEAVLNESRGDMPQEQLISLAAEKFAEFGGGDEKKVTLDTFTDYVMRSTAAGEKPWDFLERESKKKHRKEEKKSEEEKETNE